MIPVANCNPWMHSENIKIKYLSNKHTITENYRQKLAIIWNEIASKIGSLNDDNKTIYEAYNNLINNKNENYHKNEYFNEEKDIDISKNINNMIFFAGEYTDPIYYGSLHAGYNSGIRVLKELFGKI